MEWWAPNKRVARAGVERLRRGKAVGVRGMWYLTKLLERASLPGLAERLPRQTLPSPILLDQVQVRTLLLC